MTMLPTDPSFASAEMDVLWLGDPDSSEPERVGGTVTPDTWIVSRDGVEAVEVIVADKRRMTVPVPDGTTEVGVPSRLASTPSLEEHQAAAIAALALDLEQEVGWPVDAEFAFGNGQLYLLQCRPITTLQGADQR